ncbi:uncharacterized protein LOC125649413 isoform X3 [Ostrea edulis]|uniref:uncharacterized protein LOC125649413 isoform X3 n=1 Tax=Ostrea edulis TaxID=37623 RepID=UPI0020955C19|nr:uncharacterized protein LOC125649413 isoform X3 [Ostrea edulis]
MYGKDNSCTPVIVLAECPPLEELIAITVCITRNLQTSSSLQPHIIRCRELIFTEPDIIATPSFNSDNVFHLVLKRALFNTGKLQTRFSKIGLQSSDPQAVTSALFQSCLHYTLLARIAPSWNKAGQWLIQGRDFLSHQGYLNAVKIDLVVTHTQLHMSLTASTIRFPVLQLCDIEVLPASQRKFMEDQNFVISGESIGSTWCHVLPSMKKGEIINVSRQLPTDGPFRTYKDIKRHWKNSYGYRLPEDDVIYYQIHFKPLGDRVFTYPNVCLRARDIHCLPRVDPRPILVAFMQDLKNKMPTVCGYRLQLQTKANYLTMDLCSANQKEHGKTCNTNLGPTKQTPGKVIYRNFSVLSQKSFSGDLSSQFSSMSSVHSTMSSNKSHFRSNSQAENVMQGESTGVQKTNLDGSIHTGVQKTDLDGSIQDEFTKIPENRSQTVLCSGVRFGTQKKPRNEGFNSLGSRDTLARDSHVPLLSDKVRSSSTINCEERIIPRFSAKKPSNTVTQTMSSPGSQPSRIVPVFKARKDSTQTKGLGNQPQKGSGKERQKQLSISHGVQERSSVASKISEMMVQAQDKAENPANVPIPSPSTPSSIRPVHPSTLSITQPVHQSTSYITRPIHQSTPYSTRPIHQSMPVLKSLHRASLQTTTQNIRQTKSTTTRKALGTVLRCETGKYINDLHSQKPVPGSVDLDSDDEFIQSLDVYVKKRITNETFDSGVSLTKKPRTKPTIQNVDVEALAREEQLNKVNNITLMTWLKNRGIQCKSRDRRQDLVTKILTALNVRLSEQ